MSIQVGDSYIPQLSKAQACTIFETAQGGIITVRVIGTNG